MKLYRFILFFTIMALFPFWSHSKEKSVIDFNYPQDVSKNAIADLNQALKTGNGQVVVDALIRYSIAQSGISQENMGQIVSRIDSTIALEKKPEIKALLRYFEASVFIAYRNHYERHDRINPTDTTLPADYSEWDRTQLNGKAIQLIEAAMSQPEALKAVPVTSLKGLLRYDDMGAVYVPTLFEFLSMKCSELADDCDAQPLKNRIDTDWVNGTKSNVPAHIYALIENRRLTGDIYKEFSTEEHVGLALSQTSAYNDYYPYFKEYVARFPQSRYTPAVLNKIYYIESQNVQLSYPEYATTGQRIKVDVKVNNTNDFTINVYRVPDNLISSNRDRYGDDLDVSRLKLVHSEQHHIEGTVPFYKNDYRAELGALPYGQYVIVPSYTANGKKTTLDPVGRHQLLTVTDIIMFNLSHVSDDENSEESNNRIFTVNATTGIPLKGVSITGPLKNNDREKGYCTTRITNAEGSIELPGDSRTVYGDYMATYGEDKYGPTISFYAHELSARGLNTEVNVFTDLAIYRPGETIQWSLIASQTSVNMRQLLTQKKLRVAFRDPNGKGVDTVIVVTDQYGRAEGKFVVPTDRMNGSFSIAISDAESKYGTIAYHHVDVSEYKTPTFAVTFPDAKFSFIKGEPVKITGLVETYSGMPVANAEVKLQLYQNAWNWWWRYSSREKGELLQDSVVTTDATGHFTIEFPATLFKENTVSYYRWAHYNYSLQAACTDAAGETQDAAHAFIVGERSGLEFTSYETTHVNTKPLTLPLVYNTTSETEKSITCDWMLTSFETGDTVATGRLDTAKPTIDLTKMPSGVYNIKVSIPGREDDDEQGYAYAKVILYRLTDKEAPVKNTAMWIPAAGRSVDQNNVVHITIGTSSPESHIYYIAQSRHKIVAQGWLHYKPGMHTLDIAIPKADEEFISVQLVSAHERQTLRESFTMRAPEYAQQLKVKITTFRDKLVPGEHEHWTMQLVDKDGKPRPGALMLEMMDKAINSLADNTWQFSVPLSSQSLFSMRSMSLVGNNSTELKWQHKTLNEARYSVPELYTYDQDLFGYLSRARYRMGAAAGGAMMLESAMPMMRKGMQMNATLDTGMAEMEETVDAMSADYNEEKSVISQEAQAQLDNIKLREADVKTALWMPMLTSDDQGNVQIEFDAPEFNTTWVMQAIGYDQQLYTDRTSREVLTQKPIMVKSSVPRFLRHGDVVTLAANVQNATEAATKATAIIELFDPRSGDIYKTQSVPVSLDAMGTQAVKIPWTVPADIPFVGFRIKAATSEFGDGEQVMIPVLEAISPVIETKPFYIEAGKQQFVTDLPQFTDGARITLEYCDNPVWYCVTALPTIFDENYEISTRMAHNLFAIEVAQGVAKAQPQIREAVAYWKSHAEDSTLVSMLAKNQDLKIGTLMASPWVREADRQTLRMSRLDELMDETLMTTERNKIIDALQKMQLSDGGWPWFTHPGCKSSYYTTQTVLELIGEIRHLGFLHADEAIKKMTTRAVAYLDSETLRMHKESHNKKELGWLSDYAYVRTLYKDVPLKGESKSLFDKVIKYMNKNWGKGLSLGQKAFTAMTLNRNGYQATARDIMESVRQFALVKPELGMYWDNLQMGWRYVDKVGVTATILQALNECDPRQQELDNVRKWMLLMKQTNDWGSSSLAADAVYSLLSTGSQWLERNPMPTVTVGGEKVTFDKVDEYLGYCRKTIPAHPGASVIIEREGNSPAWGAIYSQFRARMTDIQEVAITELSINKEFYRYNNDGTLSSATSFKVGDKVQVRLVIKNNKDLDFVTVKDERAACFEPLDQTSHYERADYSWYYHETKDAITNLFFTDLQKGTHVINYDVYVTATGQFSAGIATAQCQYAPQITAHSAGRSITVE